MPGLHLYRSNRLEVLADALAEVMRAPLKSPFEAEIVAVHSLGMRRWLALELAARTGIAMNIQCPFPAELAHRVFSAALQREQQRDPAFDRDVLPWRILSVLPELLNEEAFRELRDYVEDNPLKEYQLAMRVASVFDRYIAYRPELILGWETGNDSSWQANLWRDLSDGHEGVHAPALLQRLERSLANGAQLRSLPSRISLFGTSSLPPLYVHLLRAVANQLDVHLFLLSPTREYWGDTLSQKEQDRSARRAARAGRTTPPLAPGAADPLLASYGKVGRDFSELLLDLDPTTEHDLCINPQPSSLLSHIQANIFRMREPDGAALPRVQVSPEDRSVQVHVCHSPMRELEVLHDQLLDLFERMPGLAPRDILVCMPDVATYAPFIEAVFGAPEDERLRIPFTIADQPARGQNSVADAFLRILAMPDSRYTAPQVMALFDTPSIRHRFGIQESDLDRLRDWIRRTGIRWGIDGAHRATFDVPPLEQNTWRFGLDRLLLGYALPGDEHSLFQDILPDRDIEGSLAVTLGQLAEFADQLFACANAWKAARPISEWVAVLREMLVTFFSTDDEFAAEIREVAGALDALEENVTHAGFDRPVEFHVLRAHLAGALADTDTGSGFLAGHTTFCALKPMRSIPFRVICFVGLDDTAYPRHERALAFDLTAQHPKRGDRTLRDDDRYLFLEGLLSAREIFYLSYCGLSARNQSESPPSVLVSELIEYIDQHFEHSGVVTKHRLQAFSPAYFSGENPRLFSYSHDNGAAASAGEATRTPLAPFIAAPLPELPRDMRHVTVDQLTEFFRRPAEYFLRRRLRLRLPSEEEPLAETEPPKLDGLTGFIMRQDIVAQTLAGNPRAADLAIARATGLLPPGYAGDSEYANLTADANALLERLTPKFANDPLAPVAIDETIGEWRLTGYLGNIRPTAMIRYRAVKMHAADRLLAWIAHLALNCAAPAGHPRVTELYNLDVAARFKQIENAREHLDTLLNLYGRGLCEPLRFFPDSSFEFARRTLKPKPRETKNPIDAALEQWWGNEYSKSKAECDELAYEFAFRGIDDLLDEDFRKIALTVYGPLLDALEELK